MVLFLVALAAAGIGALLWNTLLRAMEARTLEVEVRLKSALEDLARRVERLERKSRSAPPPFDAGSLLADEYLQRKTLGDLDRAEARPQQASRLAYPDNAGAEARGFWPDPPGVSPHASAPAPSAAPSKEFSEGLVRDLYSRWLRDRERPDVPPGTDAVPLGFAKLVQVHAAALPVPLFADAGQIAEFVRFSPANASEGLVLPHPEAALTAELQQLLFPEATDAFLGNRANLLRLQPVRVRQQDGFWEKAE